jgi:hypothetical protein
MLENFKFIEDDLGTRKYDLDCLKQYLLNLFEMLCGDESADWFEKIAASQNKSMTLDETCMGHIAIDVLGMLHVCEAVSNGETLYIHNSFCNGNYVIKGAFRRVYTVENGDVSCRPLENIDLPYGVYDKEYTKTIELINRVKLCCPCLRKCNDTSLNNEYWASASAFFNGYITNLYENVALNENEEEARRWEDERLAIELKKAADDKNICLVIGAALFILLVVLMFWY